MLNMLTSLHVHGGIVKSALSHYGKEMYRLATIRYDSSYEKIKDTDSDDDR